MSTRTNIVVKDGCKDRKPVYLYRHWDGYPESMFPMFGAIWEAIDKPDWQHGRQEKAAGVIIQHGNNHEKYPALEPTTQLHGDVGWVYVVSVDESPEWSVEVYVPQKGFWDAPDLDKCKSLGVLSIPDDLTDETAKKLQRRA